ncbi:TPA: trypsin-like serine protease [bacterium]|nr:trypsin-like serine protease [bacterium]
MRRFMLILVSLFTLGVGCLNLASANNTSEIVTSSTQTSITVEPFSEVYKSVIKGVVGIQTMFGNGGSIGSGFIYDEDDNYHYVITNYHVISTRTEAFVRLFDGRIIEAEILGRERAIDVALLKMEKQDGVVVLQLGNSDYLNVGENVYAIGNPLSIFYHGHLTKGVVSGVRRLFTYTEDIDERQYLIQTDTPVNPGNSGGPLFNALGKVIGINSSKSIISYDDQQPAESISFAIPINDVVTVAKQLKTNLKFFPTSLGDNSIKDIKYMTKWDKEKLSIPEHINIGVYVKPKKESSVFYNIDAEGIIIKKVNGVEIIDAGHLRNQYYHQSAGFKLEMEILIIKDNGVTEETITVSTLAKARRI